MIALLVVFCGFIALKTVLSIIDYDDTEDDLSYLEDC
jgi:hypothetical protein